MAPTNQTACSHIIKTEILISRLCSSSDLTHLFRWKYIHKKKCAISLQWHILSDSVCIYLHRHTLTESAQSLYNGTHSRSAPFLYNGT